MVHKTRNARVAAAALAAVLALGAACGDDDDEGAGGGEETTTTEAAGGATAGTATLTIEGFAFPALTVDPGAEVKVVNRDSAPHTVTADEGEEFDASVDGQGEASFSAPDEPGSYAYHCNVHPNMKAELVVR